MRFHSFLFLMGFDSNSLSIKGFQTLPKHLIQSLVKYIDLENISLNLEILTLIQRNGKQF